MFLYHLANLKFKIYAHMYFLRFLRYVEKISNGVKLAKIRHCGKCRKNLEKTVINRGSLNFAMISMPYREKLLLLTSKFKQIALGPYSRITISYSNYYAGPQVQIRDNNYYSEPQMQKNAN